LKGDDARGKGCKGFEGVQDVYDASCGMWGWQPEPPVPKVEMPPLWSEYSTPDGEVYYYNSKTGLTQWERPPELDQLIKPVDKLPDKTFTTAGAAEISKGKGGSGLFDTKGKGDRDKDRLVGVGDDESAKQAARPRRRGKGDGDVGKKKDGGGKDGKDGAEFGPPGCNLFVFHLPDDWTDEDLNEYFAPHGPVVSAKVMKELGTGRSRGFGFVSYEDRVSASTAIKKMQGYKILGKRLKVEFKKGEVDSKSEMGDLDDDEGSKKSYPDDERLISYLRAISAKNVVQSLKEDENREEERVDGGEEAKLEDDSAHLDGFPMDDEESSATLP